MSIAKSIGLSLAENGILPDAAVRLAIRRLNAARLRQEAQRCDETEFARRLAAGSIAYATREANEQHYELPPEFFRLVLGKHLKYSGCYFPIGVTGLDDAESASLGLTCERAELEDGMNILELGCGWGSLTLWMAERYPNARITAVSNAAPQREFILDEAKRRDLSNIEVITADMNDFAAEGVCDRVVSVEMFEHMRNYDALLARIASWLAPGGKLFVHIFCHKRYPYIFEVGEGIDWMARYFFTAGLMPSYDLLTRFNRDLAPSQRWWLSGDHYARTAEAWLANFDARRDEIDALFARVYGTDADLWANRWRIFFLSCAELFGYGGGAEWGIGHYLFEPAAARSEAGARDADLAQV